MNRMSNVIKNPFLIILISGLLLNIPFFIREIWGEFLAFFLIAPVFISLNKIPNNKKYFAGLLFFGAWIIPTSLWYFNFMEWWEACLKLTYFSLMGLIFVAPNILKKKNIILELGIIISVWVLITFLRINLPFTENWWIPQLAYTQWQNFTILQLASFTGIFGIIFTILLSNALLAYAWMKEKKYLVMVCIVSLVMIFSFGNYHIEKISNSHNQPFILIGIQSSPENGFYANANKNDVKTLQKLTQNALLEVENKEKKIFVLWPENMIQEDQTSELQNFAKENNIYLIFNREEQTEGNPFNTVVMVGANGKEVLKNYKTHVAPSEKIQIKKEVHNSIEIEAVKITSDICYDLHYSDISKRIQDNDLLFSPVDDDRFGSFMPYLHARDAIFRAIENRINIFTASTNGPTMFIDKYGVIKKGPLEMYNEGYLIVNK